MGAFDDNLEVLNKTDDEAGEWGRAATQDLIRSRIKIKSLNFMRGRTFVNKFLIIDEAQNLTPKQMKTLVTRAGPGTKIVCLGNIAQIDTPYLTEGSSGPDLCGRPLQGLVAQRARHAGARRALAAGGLRRRGAVKSTYNALCEQVNGLLRINCTRERVMHSGGSRISGRYARSVAQARRGSFCVRL